MPVPPAGFPLYISGGKYNVSFSFPGIPPLDKVSDISKSIEGKSPALLLVPNVEFIQKFIKGDIGIGDSVLKGAFTKNFNSPITTGNEFVFKKLAELTKMDVSDIEKYRKPPQTPTLPTNAEGAAGAATGAAGAATGAAGAATGAAGAATGAATNAANTLKSKSKFQMPASEIKVNSEFDLGGLKGLEKSMLKSIFETQKPYMEIAKLVVANISKAEDIVARILPLALPLGTPLNTKSAKPIGNAGSGARPKALGFGGGVEIKKAIAKLDALSKKGGETIVTPDGLAIRASNATPGNTPLTASQSAEQTNSSNNDSAQTDIPPDGYDFRVVSKVFSTGSFDPNIDYEYTYINLPAEEDAGENDQGLNLNDDGDPYKGFKPDCIILGIFDSKGNPLNPNSPLDGYDNNGQKVQARNNQGVLLTKAGWILDSPKWKFPSGVYQWPRYGTPTYRYKGTGTNLGQTRSSKTKPAPDIVADSVVGDWEIMKYDTIYPDAIPIKKNLLNNEDAIKGDPVIENFDSLEVTEYQSFFNDLIEFRLATTDGISPEDKAEARAAVYPQINVPAHLENVFLYGQSKSSVYNPINVPDLPPKDNPYPDTLRYSMKPYKIYSAPASADSRLRGVFGARMDDRSGNIWVDPEADYQAKIIRIDPTTKIKYTKPGQSEPIVAEIQAFVKNNLILRISDDRIFNIEIYKSTDSSVTNPQYNLYKQLTGLTAYNLENWNYNDNDGILNDRIGFSQSDDGGVGFGNTAPVKNDKNGYRVTMWGEINTPYYDTVGGYLAYKEDANKYVEIEKQTNGSWTFQKFSFDTVSEGKAIEILRPTLESTGPQIDFLYNQYKLNQNYGYPVNGLTKTKAYTTYTSDPGPFPLSASNSVQQTYVVKDAVTASNTVTFATDLRNELRFANSIIFRRINVDKPYTYSDKDIEIIVDTTKTDAIVYDSAKNETIIKFVSIFKNISGTNLRPISKIHWIHQIKYNVLVGELFKRKIRIPVSGLYKLTEDKTIVEIQNNIITKWFYMTPLRLDGTVSGWAHSTWSVENPTAQNGNLGYANGEIENVSQSGQIYNTLTRLTVTNTGSNTGYASSTTPLPKNGYKRTLTIEVGTGNGNPDGLWRNSTTAIPIQRAQDVQFNSFQIRITTPNNPNGEIIDPAQVFNDQLKTSKPFVNLPGTKYGHGSSESPQEIGVIERFMLTEFDTESYYIIEGVLPEIADELLGSTQSDSGGAGGAGGAGAGGASGGGDYKLPDAIGAIKVFISFLVDIFSKLIPAIKKLLKLLKDPLSFITDIVGEKLGEGFPFLSPEAFDTFKSAVKIAKSAAASGGTGASVLSGAANVGQSPPTPSATNASGQASGVTSQANSAAGQANSAANSAAGQANNLNTSSSGAVAGASGLANEKKSKLIKKVENKIKSSKLNGVVFVDTKPKLRSVLDGVGTIPFELFGKDLSFGMELNMSKLPDGSPLKLVFPKNLTLSKLSSDSDTEGNKNADKDNNNSLLSDNLTKPRTSIGPAGSQNTLPNGTPLNSNDYKIVDIKYSTGEYIPGVDYNYIYITKDVENLLVEADELVAKGTADDLRKAQEKLEAAKKLDPQNKLIDERLKDVKKKNGAFDSKVQPLLKFILGFVTLPLKIVAKIIQYIMDFFKSLTNPLKLPTALVEFLSFKWILDFFIPPGPPLPGLLKLMGISFDPTKLIEWTTLSSIPNPKKLIQNMNDKLSQANNASNNLLGSVNTTAGAAAGAAATGAAGAATGAAGAATGAAGAATGAAGAATGAASTATENANNLSESLKTTTVSSSSFPWPMPLPKGDHLIPDDFELADLNQFISMPFTAKLPTYTARQIRTSPKNPLKIFWPVLCLIEKIINSIIDFFWSLLGIEAIIPPPHIKICKALDDGATTPEDLQKILNGEVPKGADTGATQSELSGQPKDSNTEAGSAFMYIITLPDGRQVEAKNDEELQKFIDENKDFGYDFQF